MHNIVCIFVKRNTFVSVNKYHIVVLHNIVCMCYDVDINNNVNNYNKGVRRMHKLAETLIDKHLTKAIGNIALEVCLKEFDGVFKEVCDQGSGNDTTIGATYRRLEKMANEAVSLKMNDLINEVTDEMGLVKRSPHNNPFAAIAYSLWEEFLYYYDIKGIVESYIGDEWEATQEILTKQGVLDEHGDFIKK